MRKAITFIRQLGTTTRKNSGNGYLYNWYVANNTNLPLSGWHVPTYSDFNTLITYLGARAGGYMKEIGYTYWDYPNRGADNSSGFTGYGSGVRAGIFTDILLTLYIWGYGTQAGYIHWVRLIFNSITATKALIADFNKVVGASIRLIKDNSSNPGTITDYDGNVYDCVTIGTQVWTVQNWKCTHYSDGSAIPEVTDATTWSGLTTGARCAYNNDHSYV